MAQDSSRGGIYRAATASFDFQNPASALGGLLQLTCELTQSPRAALYELAEAEGGFSPRFAQGLPVTDLGRLASSSDNPVRNGAESIHALPPTGPERSALGLPL